MDPFRNSEKDIADALEHAGECAGECESLDLDDFTVEQAESVPIEGVLAYDDYSSWGEWGPGELAAMSQQERSEELEGFRGAGWAAQEAEWSAGIPAVVVVISDDFVGVGDGRGRLSFAVGMGIETVPVVWVTQRSVVGKLKRKLLK